MDSDGWTRIGSDGILKPPLDSNMRLVEYNAPANCDRIVRAFYDEPWNTWYKAGSNTVIHPEAYKDIK